MKTLSDTESRANYAQVLDVVNNREETIITRAAHEPVVIVSLADYQSLRETAYLMRSPINARRLLDSIDNLETGRGQQHHLIEDRSMLLIWDEGAWGDYLWRQGLTVMARCLGLGARGHRPRRCWVRLPWLRRSPPRRRHRHEWSLRAGW